MHQINLSEYQTTTLLGAGADYEVRLATEIKSGKSVVLKRPLPQTISRRMHLSAEKRSEQTISFYKRLGNSIPQLSPMIGYMISIIWLKSQGKSGRNFHHIFPFWCHIFGGQGPVWFTIITNLMAGSC